MNLERQVLQFTNITPGQSGDIRALPLGITAVGYKLNWTGTYTQSATAGALNADSPFGFFANITLQLGGGFNLKSADGRFWKFYNQIQRKGVPNNFVAPAVTSNAVTPISAQLFMDLAQPEMVPPLDQAFVLDTRLLSALNLVFNWGTAADIATNSTSITLMTMTVVSLESPTLAGPASRQQVSVQGPTAPTAAGNLDFIITSQGPAYRGIAISFRSGNTAPNDAAGDDTICNNISLIADNAVRYLDQEPYGQIQQENKAVFLMQSSWPAGWVVLDFAKDKTLAHLLYTQTRKQLILRLNLNSLPSNPWIVVYPINDILVIRRAVGTKPAGVRSRVLTPRR